MYTHELIAPAVYATRTGIQELKEWFIEPSSLQVNQEVAEVLKRSIGSEALQELERNNMSPVPFVIRGTSEPTHKSWGELTKSSTYKLQGLASQLYVEPGDSDIHPWATPAFLTADELREQERAMGDIHTHAEAFVTALIANYGTAHHKQQRAHAIGVLWSEMLFGGARNHTLRSKTNDPSLIAHLKGVPYQVQCRTSNSLLRYEDTRVSQ